MESFPMTFAYYGGFFLLAGLLAWVGYRKRARLPGFNRWHLAAIVVLVLGAAATYAAHELAMAMGGALKG